MLYSIHLLILCHGGSYGGSYRGVKRALRGAAKAWNHIHILVVIDIFINGNILGQLQKKIV
jgi:hypothetical protein